MTYYNPSVWLDHNDSLIPEVENRIMAKKLVKRESRPYGLTPSNYGEYLATIEGSDETLRIAEYYDDEESTIKIIVSVNNNVLRRGEFNQKDIHRNPETKTKIYPPHHMHFPSKKHPDLNALHTYAYPLNSTHSRENILNCFYDACNIKIEGFSGIFDGLFKYK